MQNRSFHLALRIIAVLAALIVAVLGKEVLLLSFMGLVVSVVLSFPVDRLSRVMPRGAAVLLTLLALGGAAFGVGTLLLPRVSEQVSTAKERLPEAVSRIETWFQSQTGQNQKLANSVADPAKKVVEGAAGVVVPAAKGLVAGGSALVYILVIALFLVHQPEFYLRGLRRLIPPEQKAVFDEACSRIGSGLRHWVGGILVAMALMGTLTAIGLRIAGIENWLLLGMLTFFGTFVPYVGAISSAVPGMLLALAQSPHHLLLAAFVYLGVHLVEGYIVQPFIMKKAVETPPALLLAGQAFFGILLGLPGAIVAAPLLVCCQILVEYLYIERRLERPESSQSATAPSVAAG